MKRRPSWTSPWVWAAALTALVLAYQLTLAWRGTLRYQFDHHVNDDVFYYLQWAWNVAHGTGPTFDGINRTNGVQPLWAVMLAGLAATGLDKEGLVRGTLVLSAVLNAVSMLALFVVLRRIASPVIVFAGLVAWTHLQSWPQLMQSGMETSLNAVVQIFWLGMAVHYARQATRRRAAWLGALSGLVVLARVDNVVFAGGAGLAVLVLGGGSNRDRIQRLLVFGATALAVAGPYFLYNLLAFSHPLPISGRVKQYSHWLDAVRDAGGYLAPAYVAEVLRSYGHTFTTLLVQLLPDSLWRELRRLGDGPAQALLYAGFAGLALAAAWLRPRQAPGDTGARVVLAFAVATLLHLWIVLFLVGKYSVYTRWYFVPQLLALCGAVVVFLNTASSGLRERHRRAWNASRLLVGLAATGVLARSMLIMSGMAGQLAWPYRTGNFLQTRYDVARWMDANLRPGAVCASFNAGQLGYFSNRPVINLDGLVNNDLLLEWHRDGKPLVGYLDRMQVEYLVDWELADGRTARTTFHHVPYDRLRLVKSWDVPIEVGPQRTFHVFEYLPREGTVAFTPFLAAVEDYP